MVATGMDIASSNLRHGTLVDLLQRHVAQAQATTNVSPTDALTSVFPSTAPAQMSVGGTTTPAALPWATSVPGTIVSAALASS